MAGKGVCHFSSFLFSANVFVCVSLMWLALHLSRLAEIRGEIYPRKTKTYSKFEI